MININIKKELHGANGDFYLDVNLDIKQGEFVALIGKSGSGKTTLLRILAGLEKSNGTIKVNTQIWQDKDKFLKVQKRNIGFVFQDFALFENMNVEQNLLFVNKDKYLAKKLLEITELDKLKNRMPNTLSGGQKQRVSLCRSLMNNPQILLMDEPLSALDTKMRNKLQSEIQILHKEFNLTTIMVSHDLNETYRLANYIVELNDGKIIKKGTKKEILLDNKVSKNFLLEGELLDIVIKDQDYFAIVSLGNKLIELKINKSQLNDLKVGDKIDIDTRKLSL
jgi:molybdate transport system ATP-binding protein